MNGTPDRQWLDYFHGGFTFACHELLAWGYQDARSSISGIDTEETISKEIVKAIKKRLDSIQTSKKFDNFFAEVETHPMEDERAGKECPRIDIKIEGSETKPRPQFIFEAKRLKKSSHPIGDYLGDEGLGCFLRCQYAENYPSAGMLGYIQDAGSISHWKRQLSYKFKGSTLRISEPLQTIKILDELPYEWFSKHSRIKDAVDYPDIGIYHIFLLCDGID